MRLYSKAASGLGLNCLLGLCFFQTLADDKCRDAPLRVAIDIGHSPADPGTESASGKFEYGYNQRFANELVTLSKRSQKLNLYILDQDAKATGLTQRTQSALQAKSDVFLSIHHDSVNDKYIKTVLSSGKPMRVTDAFRGHSIFVSSINPQYAGSLRLAELIGRNLKDAGQYPTLHHAEPIPGEGRKLLSWELGVYDAPFAVLRSASMPAVLLEVGVISNKSDEQLLDVDEYRTAIESAVVSALEGYCVRNAR